ncbi:unnamed protein product [Citrullus colocynthis]|uniref:Uncharacterized protein n=1 Tax=Citrullus colocynthis TaxID=252529 RepID=A0ABP0YZV5_9ROSI
MAIKEKAYPTYLKCHHLKLCKPPTPESNFAPDADVSEVVPKRLVASGMTLGIMAKGSLRMRTYTYMFLTDFVTNLCYLKIYQLQSRSSGKPRLVSTLATAFAESEYLDF